MSLTDKETLVYQWLLRHDERPAVKELGALLGLNRMSVSRALAALEEVGAIKAERKGAVRQQIIMSTVEVVMSPAELLLATSPLARLVNHD